MLVVVAGVLPGFLTAGLAPRIRTDFAFGDSSVGLAVAAFYVVSMLASAPFGRLGDRIGAVRGMRLAAAFTAASSVGIAAFAQSTAALIPLLLVGGLGNALAGPAVGALLKRAVATGRQGLAFGAQQAGAPLGALLAGLALPAVAIPLGWRFAYLGTAALAVVAAGAAPGGRPSASGGRSGFAARGRAPGQVHALAVAAALASAAAVGLVSFLVLYSVESGMSESAAGLLLGGVSFVAMVSRVALGALADRGRQHALRPVPAMLALSVVGYLLLIAGEPLPIVLGALAAGSLGWAWPGALTLAVVQRAPEAPAWAVGVMMTGLFAGAVAGPLVVGLLAESDAFAAAWAVCAALALAAAATVLATDRRQARGGRAGCWGANVPEHHQ